jgi:hypothetical protein
MENEILLENTVMCRKMIKKLVSLFSRQTSTLLSCQVLYWNKIIRNELNFKEKYLQKNDEEDGAYNTKKDEAHFNNIKNEIQF